MLSEQRLHPASLLFAFADSVKKFALPGLIAALSVGRQSTWQPTFGRFQPPETWELWLMLLLVPSVLAAIARYVSFRLRYDETELVIRSGIVFRNERHVPYTRIQNLDAVQNLVHRLLGVIEVRIETGAGKEPEATISVVPEAALADMRRRVFAGRMPAAALDAEVPALPAAEQGRTLLQLPVRELMLFGFLENRGLVIMAAAYGALWEFGLFNAIFGRLFEDAETRGTLRSLIRGMAAGGVFPLLQAAAAAAGIVLLLAAVRLLSMVWAVVRLYGFRLSKIEQDLRTDFGLATRVSATIPLRRVQAMTVREGPLYRLVSRVSVRVETAGGGQGTPEQPARRREALAPLLPPRDLPALVSEVLPGVDVGTLDWYGTHPLALRRAVRPAVAMAVVLTLAAALVIHPAVLVLLPLVVAWAVFRSYKYVRNLAWAVTPDVVAFRSGWLWRTLTIARVAKIQAVARIESPFDRRWDMARVRVDTAGAGDRSHRIDIPYLPHSTAVELQARLAAGAADTPFRW